MWCVLLGGGDGSRAGARAGCLRRRTAAEERVERVLGIAERSADREDREAEPGEQQRHADHDAEQGQLARHVRRVERSRQSGLSHPHVAGAVGHGLLCDGIDRGKRGVLGAATRHELRLGVPGLAV